MIILSYDFSNDRMRTKFSKFLEKYGRRLQYSVFEIRNSKRVLQNIIDEIELAYKDKFTGADKQILCSRSVAAAYGPVQRKKSRSTNSNADCATDDEETGTNRANGAMY